MSIDSANVFDAALHLPDDDRASLAYQLLQSLKPAGISDESDSAFHQELEQRVARYQSGETNAADWKHVADRLRSIFRKKGSS